MTSKTKGALPLAATRAGEDEAALRSAVLNLGLKLGEGFDKGGQPYTWMVDCREVLLTHGHLARAARLLWQRIKPYQPQFVGGMTLAANPLTIAMLYESVADGYEGLDAFLIRREPKGDGLRKLIEGPAIPRGARVVLLDDIVNSGDTQRKALAALASTGAQVVAVAALIDTESSGARWLESQGLPLETVFTMRELGIAMQAGNPGTMPPPAWRYGPLDRPTYFAVKSSPVVAEGRIFKGADRGFLVALDLEGQELWRYDVQDHDRGIHATPLVFDGRVIVGAYDGWLSSLDAAIGAIAWRVRVGQWIGSSAAVDPTTRQVFVGVEYGASDGSLVALDADTGTPRWEFPTNHYVHGSPLYDAERRQVIVGSNDFTLYAVDAATGQARWRYVTDGEIKGKPALDDAGSVYVTSFDGQLYAIDAATGQLRWRRRVGIRAYAEPLIHGDLVIAGGYASRVVAFERESGRVRWVATTGDRVLGGAIALPDGRLAVGSADGCLYLLDADTGATLASLRTGSPILSTPAVAEGKLLFASCDGHLYALRL